MVLVPFQPSMCSTCYVYWQDEDENRATPLHGKVGEFTFDNDTKQWMLLRVREDKTPAKGQFGNYISTAEKTFMDIVNYIDLKCLYDVSFQNDVYFKQDAPLQYRAMTKYINNAKRASINFMAHALRSNKTQHITVLDIGSGKGQDINKFAGIGADKLICIDKDPEAIKELINRKLSAKHIKYPHIVTKIADLAQTNHIEAVLNELAGTQVDILTLHLVLHYLMPNIDKLVNVMKMVRKGGFVSIVCVDGHKMFEQLITEPRVDVVENGKVKYQYERLF